LSYRRRRVAGQYQVRASHLFVGLRKARMFNK
jgi:hypothetical protein